jgi:chromosome segregation ATPase
MITDQIADPIEAAENVRLAQAWAEKDAELQQATAALRAAQDSRDTVERELRERQQALQALLPQDSPQRLIKIAAGRAVLVQRDPWSDTTPRVTDLPLDEAA